MRPFFLTKLTLSAGSDRYKPRFILRTLISLLRGFTLPLSTLLATKVIANNCLRVILHNIRVLLSIFVVFNSSRKLMFEYTTEVAIVNITVDIDHSYVVYNSSSIIVG